SGTAVLGFTGGRYGGTAAGFWVAPPSGFGWYGGCSPEGMNVFGETKNTLRERREIGERRKRRERKKREK
ncbi:hypothetical protein A2U01_0058249, partial [Trifolium medium]|nr:hypothetical protein [Trifolium medium]